MYSTYVHNFKIISLQVYIVISSNTIFENFYSTSGEKKSLLKFMGFISFGVGIGLPDFLG